VADTRGISPADDHISVETPRRIPYRVKQALAQIEELAFGTWFSFTESEEASPVRLKLSWYSQLSGNYMFVDSMGIRSAVKDRLELATLLADGKATIINNDRPSFVQRALEAVRRALSGNEKATAQLLPGR
jgi:hypothetical protein